MKPLVAIDEVLDYLLFIFFRCISVEDCAKSEKAVSAYGPVRGWNVMTAVPRNVMPGPRTGPYGQYAISDLAQSSTETDPKYLAKR